MKELLKREDSVQSISFIDEITDDCLVGIIWGDGEKNIVFKNNEGAYVGIGQLGFCGWTRGTKKSYVYNAIKQENVKVYLFESEYDLLKWCFNNEETF